MLSLYASFVTLVNLSEESGTLVSHPASPIWTEYTSVREHNFGNGKHNLGILG